MSRAATPARIDEPAESGERREITPRDLRVYVEAAGDQLMRLLPANVKPEKVAQVVALCATNNPKILACSKVSIMESVLKATALGLDLTPGFNEAALVPRWTKGGGYVCTFQSMYQGVIKLAHQSPLVASVRTALITTRDEFSYEWDESGSGASLVLTHKVNVQPGDGRMVGVYAVGKLTNGERFIEHMTLDDCLQFRERHAPRDKQDKITGPWVTDFPTMCRKTVVKAVCKYMPKSTKLQELSAAERYEIEAIADSRVVAVGEAAPTRSAALGARLAQRATPALEAPVVEAEDPMRSEDQPPEADPADGEPAEEDDLGVEVE